MCNKDFFKLISENSYVEDKENDENVGIIRVKTDNITRIAFISDVHIGLHIENYDNKTKLIIPQEDNISNMITLLNKINPDYIIFGGDLFEYSYMKELIDSIPATFPDREKQVEDLVYSHFISSFHLSEKENEENHFAKFFKDGKVVFVAGNHDIDQKSNSWYLFNKKNTTDILSNCIFSPTVCDNTGRKMFYEELNDFLLGNNFKKQPHIPAIVDTERKVIIYAFNSNTRTDIKTANGKIEHKFIPQVTKSDIDNFTLFSSRLREQFGDDFGSYLFIAVVHHHTSDIAGFHEIREFEGLTNAGVFKQALNEADVKLLLHGHKHWPEVYIDTAITNGGCITTISGGTICTYPQSSATPGFHVIDYNKTHYRTIRVAYQPLTYNLTNISDFPYYKLQTRNSYFKYQRHTVDIQEQIFFQTQRTLLDKLPNSEQEKQMWGVNILSGGTMAPSACGTAIGLCIMELTECRFEEYSKKMQSIITGMLDRRKQTYNHFIQDIQFTESVYKFTKKHVKMATIKGVGKNKNDEKPSFSLFGSEKSSGACIEITCWVARALYVTRQTETYYSVVSSLIMMYCKYRDYLIGKKNAQYKNNTYVMTFLLDIFTAYIHYCSKDVDSDRVMNAICSPADLDIISIQNQIKDHATECHAIEALAICKEIYSTILNGCIIPDKDQQLICWGRRLYIKKRANTLNSSTKPASNDAEISNRSVNTHTNQEQIDNEYSAEESLGDKTPRDNSTGVPYEYCGTIAHTAYALITCKDFMSELALQVRDQSKLKEINKHLSVILDENKEAISLDDMLPHIRRWLLNKYKDGNNLHNCNEYIVSHNVLCNGNELEFCDMKHILAAGATNKYDFDLIEERHFSHYTVALMLRALIYCNLTIDDNPIAELVEQLYSDLYLTNGLWSEDGTKEGVRYLFRTYEAIVAINTLAFDSLSIPMHKYSEKTGDDFYG